MPNYRTILKKVGLVLVAFGLIDIAFMIYAVSHGRSYSSSFNIFAVIAGILLLRGSLGATRLVTWFSAFMLSGFILATLFLFPFVQPFRLLVTRARLDPGSTALSWLLSLVALALLAWTYHQLRSAPVLEALKANGRPTSPPRLAFGLGLALVAFLAVMLNMTLHGAAATKAEILARQELGSSYSYSTQSIQWAGDHGSAVVVAYNDREIKYVPVKWGQ